MTPKQRNLLIAERAAAYARINEIAALLDADDKARYDARRAKRKPVTPPREPVGDPRVAVIREYAKIYMNKPTVFNNRRKTTRTVKIWRGLSPIEYAHHRYALEALLTGDYSSAEASPPGLHAATDKRCIAVILA